MKLILILFVNSTCPADINYRRFWRKVVLFEWIKNEDWNYAFHFSFFLPRNKIRKMWFCSCSDI